MSSDLHMTSSDCVSVTIGLRETITWALVLALTLLLIVSISVNVLQVGLYKLRHSKEGGAVLATKYEMDDASDSRYYCETSKLDLVGSMDNQDTAVEQEKN